MWKHWSRAAAALGVIAVVVSAGFGKEWRSIFFSHVPEPLKNVNAIVQSRIKPQIAPELLCTGHWLSRNCWTASPQASARL
jgi:hypothetical protein